MHICALETQKLQQFNHLLIKIEHPRKIAQVKLIAFLIVQIPRLSPRLYKESSCRQGDSHNPYDNCRQNPAQNLT